MPKKHIPVSEELAPIETRSEDELYKDKVSSFAPATKLFTSRELVEQDFPEPEWLVEGLLPEGLTVLAGKQKIGKSWFSLAIASRVSVGTLAFDYFTTKKQGVLYISLEENARHIQERFAMMQGLPSEDLTFLFDPSINLPGIKLIETHVKDHPTGLVVIDTLKRFLPAFDMNSYSETLPAMQSLKQICDIHDVSILALTHCNKSNADDVFDSVNGSVVVTATADNTLILQRRRGALTGYIRGDGRSLRGEFEYAFSLVEDYGWQYLGTGTEQRTTEDQQAIIEALLELDEPAGAKDIAAVTGQNYGTVRVLLARLARDGRIDKPNRGRYACK